MGFAKQNSDEVEIVGNAFMHSRIGTGESVPYNTSSVTIVTASPQGEAKNPDNSVFCGKARV